jgi:hypothetical protein
MTRRNRHWKPLLAAGLAVISAVALSSVVWAAIVSTTGQMTEIAPPPSVEFNEVESNETQFVFSERQCVTLASGLKVNITTPGTYDQVIDLTPGIIPAGTKVSSHFVHADKAGTGPPRIELEGTLTTDAPILGIIVRQGALDASDFLGGIGTVYPTGDFGRQMALNNKQNDFVILDPNRQSVTVHTDNQFHADQVRVITECRLPTQLQGCTPGYWKQDHHFDSWQVYSPANQFNAVFGVSGPLPNSLTLVEALQLNGGGVNALARHAVAALLASVHPDVDYGLTAAEVIAETQAALNSGNATLIEATKNKFNALNERGCPLN